MRFRFRAALFLCVAASYLLSASGRLGIIDCLTYYSVAKSLVLHGWFDVYGCLPDLHDNHCVPGVDGRNYTGLGILPSLAATPVLWAMSIAARIRPLPEQALQTAVSLLNVFTGAATCCLLADWVRRMGYGGPVGVRTALSLAFLTPFWQQCTKGFWSEPLFIFFGIGSAAALHAGGNRFVSLAGLSFGLAVATRLFFVALAPVFLWYAWAVARRQGASVRESWLRIGFFCLPAALCGVALAWFNYVRFGSPFRSGYHTKFPSAQVLFSTSWTEAASGLWVNPDMGLLWFMPWLVALPWLWWRLFLRHRAEAILIATLFTGTFLFFSKYEAWYGGYYPETPRMMLPGIAFLTICLAEFYAAWPRWKGPLRILPASLLCLGFGIQFVHSIYPASRYYHRMEHARRLGELHGGLREWRLFSTLGDLPSLLTFPLSPSPAVSAPPPQTGDPISYNELVLSNPKYVNQRLPDLMLLKLLNVGLHPLVALSLALALLGAAALGFRACLQNGSFQGSGVTNPAAQSSP